MIIIEFWESRLHDGEIRVKRTKGVDGVDVSFPERMEVKWGGRWVFRVGKDTLGRVPPLRENVA